VVDVVADTEAVLAHLGADRCLVAGWSGGGPHALACAARLAEAAAALVIAGVAPYGAEGLDWAAGMGQDNIDEFGAATDGEGPLRAYLDAARQSMADLTTESMVTSLDSLLPEVDRAVLTDEFGEDMVAGFEEGLRNGIEGWLEDDLAFCEPWGFGLDEIGIPTAVWQGSEDLMVPFEHGRWLADRLPGASIHLEAGQGHLSIGVGAVDAMLDELMRVASF
jgi:pimeloyl-ACP methyl ester carboxylesterase